MNEMMMKSLFRILCPALCSSAAEGHRKGKDETKIVHREIGLKAKVSRTRINEDVFYFRSSEGHY